MANPFAVPLVDVQPAARGRERAEARRRFGRRPPSLVPDLIRKNFGRIALMIALLALPVVTSASPAQAAANTCGARGNVFTGIVLNSVADVQGASAFIQARRGEVCNTDRTANNFSTAWSMVAEAGGGGGYARSGYFRTWGTGMRHFAQENDDGLGAPRERIGPSFPYNERHHYWVDIVNGRLRQMVDVTILQESTFNPFVEWGGPFEAQFAGETNYRESDVPGSFGTGWAGFHFVERRIGANNWGALVEPVADAVPTAPHYHHNAIAPQAGLGQVFDIWTDPVPR